VNLGAPKSAEAQPFLLKEKAAFVRDIQDRQKKHPGENISFLFFFSLTFKLSWGTLSNAI
jgi:hypothetical protein